MLPPGPEARSGAFDAVMPRCLRRLVAKQVLERMTALLDTDEREPQVDDRVADEVVGPFAVERHEHEPAVLDDLQPLALQGAGQPFATFLDLDRQHAGVLRERS